MGDSKRPNSSYDKRVVADDISQLLRRMNFRDADILGADIGMMIAYSFAWSHPEGSIDDVKAQRPTPVLPFKKRPSSGHRTHNKKRTS